MMSSRDKTSPRRLLRAIAIAAAFVAAGALRASAQTLIVRSAPPGARVELVADGAVSGSATADTYGDATVTMPTPAAERSVQVRVDSCGNVVRVFVSPSLPPQPEAGCTRKELWGAYVQRPTSTFVIEMNGTEASIFVSQGPPPPEWVHRGDAPIQRPGVQWSTPSSGLVLSAGVGFSTVGGARDSFCGSAARCDGISTGVATSLGGDFWIKNLVAAHVTFNRPADVTANGGGDGYRFDSRLRSRTIAIGGKIGPPLGPSRLYGIVGAVRHQATSTTTQTNDPKTVTVGGVTTTDPGGTQSFGLKTEGWGLMFGGGVEGWMSRWIGIYGEVTRSALKGNRVGGGEGELDEQAWVGVFGIRFRIRVP